MTIAYFWQMTPRETFMVIDAYLWRTHQRQRQEITAAWLTAALTRAKLLPKLAQLLVEKAKPLKGEELQKRRQEFSEMTAQIDLEVLNKARRK